MTTVPGYEAEGKGRLTVAVGCTGRPAPIDRDRRGDCAARWREEDHGAGQRLAPRAGARMTDGNGDRPRRRNDGARRRAAAPASSRPPAQLRRWLRPGIGIKRWLLVVFLGRAAARAGRRVVLRSMFRDATATDSAESVVDLDDAAVPAARDDAGRALRGRRGALRLWLRGGLLQRAGRAVPGAPGAARRAALPAPAARARPAHRRPSAAARACRCSCAG